MIAIEIAKRAWCTRVEGNVVEAIMADTAVNEIYSDLVIAEANKRLARITQADADQFGVDWLRKLCVAEARSHVIERVLVPSVNEVLGDKVAGCVVQLSLFFDAEAAS